MNMLPQTVDTNEIYWHIITIWPRALWLCANLVKNRGFVDWRTVSETVSLYIYQSNILILLCWWSFPVFLLTVKVQDQFMISWWKVIICFRVVLQRLVRSSVHSRQGPPPSSVLPPPPPPILKSQTQQQITDWPTWLSAQYNRYSSNLYHIALRFVCLAHLTLTSNRHSRREHQFVFICLLPKYKCCWSRRTHCYPNHCPLLANYYWSLDAWLVKAPAPCSRPVAASAPSGQPIHFFRHAMFQLISRTAPSNDKATKGNCKPIYSTIQLLEDLLICHYGPPSSFCGNPTTAPCEMNPKKQLINHDLTQCSKIKLLPKYGSSHSRSCEYADKRSIMW